MLNNKPFTVTVTQLNRKISFMLSGEKSFSDLCVKGEISNFTVNSRSGHIFFTLKDDNSSVRAVMFRSFAQELRFMPEDGMAVTVRGSVKCYEQAGQYQIYVSEIMSGGEGALSAAFEKLKNKLESEGVFAQKRPIPAFPSRICVITSETGAALQDILNIIGRRCPQVRVTVIPAVVQGEYAPDSIVSAIRLANETDADTIIFGRGGGSSEDLSAFNSEAVARAVFGSRIPTISAVGHETDFTLADFAADKRAPTPSAAAELSVPDKGELFSLLDSRAASVGRQLNRVIENKTAALRTVDTSIRIKSPKQRLMGDEHRLLAVYERIRSQLTAVVESKSRSFAHTAAVIEALNPLAVLMRGYSITYLGEKALISTDDVKKGDKLKIRLSDGVIDAVAEDVEK